MPISPKGEPNYWLTVVTIRNGASFAPADVMAALDAENIEARPVWKPMHLQPVFRVMKPEDMTRGQADQPPYRAYVFGGAVSEDLFRRGLCLPSGTAMTDGDLDRVCDIILRCRR